jgi:hypothetical protein
MRTVTLRLLVVVLGIPFCALSIATLVLLFWVSPLVWIVDGRPWLSRRFMDWTDTFVARILENT